MFETVLIANRGEIARRVMRTLKRLGVRSVAVYTEADAGAPFVHEADDAVCIGAERSYLLAEPILAAAAASGAQAIHPGYGFLSENASFAAACADAGIVFVGPPPQAIRLMGDKVGAKTVATGAGVPVVPGLNRPALGDEEILAFGDSADYPLLVKAAAGGGGRGMRVVHNRGELDSALAAARREAKAGFGDDTVFVERFIPRARHIEVQVIADAHGHVIHLGERECSLQRRHQKVVEEAPSAVVGPELRARLGAEAVQLAQAAGYVGAGTVEFIADADDPSQHWFMEMNARLQVEHPVTELVCGVDLVELQLRVAAGERLPLQQDDVTWTGHAIEVRVNAEDPARDFLPASGPVLAYHEPVGIRVDSAIAAGSVVGTAYDSMLAKVIAHATDREGALARLDRGLAELAILGVTTNAGWLRGLIATPEVKRAELDTGFLGRVTITPPIEREPEDVARAAAEIESALAAEAAGDDPFDRVDGWRLTGLPGSTYRRLSVNGSEPIEVRTSGPQQAERVAKDAFAIMRDARRIRWTYAQDGDTLWLGAGGQAWRVEIASTEESHDAALHGDLRAPMPGQVLSIAAQEGQEVQKGDAVVVLESMKMELAITAPAAGIVKEIAVAVGDRVVVDQSLAVVQGGDAERAGRAERKAE